MDFNLADLFETVVDAGPERPALVVGERRLSYGELDARANRLAHVLSEHGIGPGDHVGLQLLNGTEYIEGMLAAFKLRAVPVNVNHRYVERELAHLYDDADLVALLHHRQFGPRVEAARTPSLRLLVSLEDGSGEPVAAGALDYDAALAAASAERPKVPDRSSDDRYIVYTGGTTGLPKGVVWRHEDIFKASMGGGDIAQLGNYVTSREELAQRLPDVGLIALAVPPLMHSSAHWLVFHQLYTGGLTVLVPHGRFDPALIWELVTRERVFNLTLVGDAMARPLLDELEAHADRYDPSLLWVIASGGAILSAVNKERLLRLLPGRLVVDGFGSSETGVLGSKQGQGGATFLVNAQTTVLDDEGVRVTPGSGVVGRLARRGHIPLAYHKDPEKTAAVFVERDGERWVLPGDMATIEEDGSITLLGRGSVSINTGGEKVYPEEVEEALKAHPDVLDAVVVGVPDDRWGERVTAVVQPVPGATPDLAGLQEHARGQLAGYKVPKALVLVEAITRTPSGKADYRWARERALQGA